MERYLILDNKGNYAVQFLTITHLDGTSVTRLQTIRKSDIDFAIKEGSFKSLEEAEEYVDTLQMDSASLGLKMQFKIKKINVTK